MLEETPLSGKSFLAYKWSVYARLYSDLPGVYSENISNLHLSYMSSSGIHSFKVQQQKERERDKTAAVFVVVILLGWIYNVVLSILEILCIFPQLLLMYVHISCCYDCQMCLHYSFLGNSHRLLREMELWSTRQTDLFFQALLLLCFEKAWKDQCVF